jgi:hypothetical protein
METESQENSPDQPPKNAPVSPTEDAQGDPKGKDKTGYGHIGNKEVPRPEGAPKPHQIF